ncbi:unnamed protein product [Hymenolepis diminuta]|uniref:Uncharacterized protein n=1 Tax=Hymenolepis diminuta TaxID=6216 RepID=A0A564ZBZ4_HYMDI|nr:unnamed protein product [Hymenolepis diminuta]
MMADPHVLTDLNIIDHALMPVCDNCSCPLAIVFFGCIALFTVLTCRPINTSTGSFSPDAGCEVNLYLSKKFCRTSSIVSSPLAFVCLSLVYRRFFQPVYLSKSAARSIVTRRTS